QAELRLRSSSDKRQGTRVAEALVTFVLPSQVGTVFQIVPAFAVAASAPFPGSPVSGASVFETAAGAGFINPQASRYFSNDDRFDRGVTHTAFRFSTTLAGKTYHASSGKM